MNDTPVDVRYPWLKVGDDSPRLPENPTERDFAKAYATMVIVYQLQRDELAKTLRENDEERREILGVVRAIQKQSMNLPMPTWAKIHSVMLVFYGAAIVWLLLSVQQRLLVEHYAGAQDTTHLSGH